MSRQLALSSIFSTVAMAAFAMYATATVTRAPGHGPLSLPFAPVSVTYGNG
jgi:hypothetical protein